MRSPRKLETQSQVSALPDSEQRLGFGVQYISNISYVLDTRSMSLLKIRQSRDLTLDLQHLR